MLNKAVPPPAEEEEDVAATEEQAVEVTQATASPQPPTITWRKSTIPFREDQHREIGRLLSKLHQELDVQLTLAEVVRFGLDQMIAALSDEAERDEALRALYAQQKRESQGNENLKHSRSQGLGRYLSARDLLSDSG